MINKEVIEQLKSEFGTVSCNGEDIYYITEDNDWNVIYNLVRESVLEEAKIEALDYVHDEILDDCETVEEARQAILNKTIVLVKALSSSDQEDI